MLIAVRPPRWLGTGVRVAAPPLVVVATLAATGALGVFVHDHLADRGTRIGAREIMRDIARARQPIIEPGCHPGFAELRFLGQ